MTHCPETIITASIDIGTAPDGSPLRTWIETTSASSRSFEERYVYFHGVSGQRYGVVNVFEITDDHDIDPKEREDEEQRTYRDWPPVRGEDY